MKKLSTALTVGLVALITVGCNNANGIAKTQLAAETTPAAQDTVLAEILGVGGHSDNSSEVFEPINEFNEIEIPPRESIPLETEEQAVTGVDNIVEELAALDEELAALDEELAALDDLLAEF